MAANAANAASALNAANAASATSAEFLPRTGTIFGKKITLKHSDNDTTILDDLGLQGVSEEEKQIIMNAFYVTPPNSTSILSLQPYPEIQQIIKPLLIALIHRQNDNIRIMEESAMEDSSIEIVYEKKGKSIGLSILLPSYLLQDSTFNTSQTIQVTGIRKGLEYGNVNVDISNGSMTKKVSLGTPGAAVAAVFSNTVERNAVEEFKKRTNRNRLALAKRRGEPLPPLSEEDADMMYTAVAVTTSVILQENVDFYENRNLPPDERERIEKIYYVHNNNPELLRLLRLEQQTAIVSFFTKTNPSSSPFHTRYRTKDTHNMLEFMRTFLYGPNTHTNSNGKSIRSMERYQTRDEQDFSQKSSNELLSQFKQDVKRFNNLTFISTKRILALHGIPSQNQINKEIIPDIIALKPYLAEFVFTLTQGFVGAFISNYTNDHYPNDSWVVAGIQQYNMLLMILPDKIVFNYNMIYALKPSLHADLPNNYDDTVIMDPLLVFLTVEIDPLTLDGFIQFDKYNINIMVKDLADKFFEKHAENIKISSRNAQRTVLDAMLKRMIARMKDRTAPDKMRYYTQSIGKSKSGQGSKELLNGFSQRLMTNLGNAQDYDIKLLLDIITMLEPDQYKKMSKIKEIQSLRAESDDKLKLFGELIKLMTNYFTTKTGKIIFLEAMDLSIANKEWYDASRIIPPEVIISLDPNRIILENPHMRKSLTPKMFETLRSNISTLLNPAESELLPPNVFASFDPEMITLCKNIYLAISELKEQPEIHKYIYTKFIDEMEKTRERRTEYEAEYVEKSKNVDSENRSLTVLFNDDKLSELFSEIKNSRVAVEESWVSFLSERVRQIPFIWQVYKRKSIYELIYEQTRRVCKANSECAKAATDYTIFHTLINEIGLFLRNTNGVPYTVEKLIEMKCDIKNKDPVFPAVKEAEKAVDRVIDGSIGSASDENKRSMEAVLESAVNALEVEAKAAAVAKAKAKAEAEDDDAAFVAVAAAAAEDDTFADALPEHSESVAVAVAAMAHEAAPIAVQLERKQTNLEKRRALAAEIATKAKEHANRREVARSKKAEANAAKAERLAEVARIKAEEQERTISKAVAIQMMEDERARQIEEAKQTNRYPQKQINERKASSKGTREMMEEERARQMPIYASTRNISNMQQKINIKTAELTEVSENVKHIHAIKNARNALLSRQSIAVAALQRAEMAYRNEAAKQNKPNIYNEKSASIVNSVPKAEMEVADIRAELNKLENPNIGQLQMKEERLKQIPLNLDEMKEELRLKKAKLEWIKRGHKGGSLTKKRNQKQRNQKQRNQTQKQKQKKRK